MPTNLGSNRRILSRPTTVLIVRLHRPPISHTHRVPKTHKRTTNIRRLTTLSLPIRHRVLRSTNTITKSSHVTILRVLTRLRRRTSSQQFQRQLISRQHSPHVAKNVRRINIRTQPIVTRRNSGTLLRHNEHICNHVRHRVTTFKVTTSRRQTIPTPHSINRVPHNKLLHNSQAARHRHRVLLPTSSHTINTTRHSMQ